MEALDARRTIELVDDCIEIDVGPGGAPGVTAHPIDEIRQRQTHRRLTRGGSGDGAAQRTVERRLEGGAGADEGGCTR